MVKTSPRRLPKFHHILKLTGEGRSIRTPLTILIRGLRWRRRMEVTPGGHGVCILIITSPTKVVYRTYF